jgi:hypothetical protein
MTPDPEWARHRRYEQLSRTEMYPPPEGGEPMTRQQGELHHLARLKAIDIPSIKHDYNAGATLEELAAKHRVHYTTLQKLVRGKTWRSVEDHTPVPEGRRRWTPEEWSYLRAHPDLDGETLARHLHRSVSAIYIARTKLRKETAP